MNIEDFVENFGQICACKFNKKYINTSLQLTFSEEESDFKGIFMGFSNRVEGYLNLIQQDHRKYLNSTYEYSLVRLIVLQLEKNTKTLQKYIDDVIDCDHDATIYLELDPGQYYILVQVDWKCNFTRDMVLNFYSQHPVSLIEDKKPIKL